MLLRAGRSGARISPGAAKIRTLAANRYSRLWDIKSQQPFDSWEDIAELHFFNNEDLTGNTGHHHSEAGFVQIGYRAGRFTPYTRYERGSFQQSDNYFAAQTFGDSYDRVALGVRFDIDLESALKMELAQTHITDRDISTFYDVLLQYAIRF